MDSDVESHGTHDEPLTILSLCDHLQGFLIENGMQDAPLVFSASSGDYPLTIDMVNLYEGRVFVG